MQFLSFISFCSSPKVTRFLPLLTAVNRFYWKCFDLLFDKSLTLGPWKVIPLWLQIDLADTSVRSLCFFFAPWLKIELANQIFSSLCDLFHSVHLNLCTLNSPSVLWLLIFLSLSLNVLMRCKKNYIYPSMWLKYVSFLPLFHTSCFTHLFCSVFYFPLYTRSPEAKCFEICR